jgi:hypothetical protein
MAAAVMAVHPHCPKLLVIPDEAMKTTQSSQCLAHVKPGQHAFELETVLSHDNAFPDWLLADLKAQNQRYQTGTETGDDLDIVEARLRSKFMNR